MSAALFVLGTSHSVAPPRVRERLHVDLDKVYAALDRIRRVPGLLDEALPLATCGRLEVYCVSRYPKRVSRLLKELVGTHSGLSRAELEAHSFLHRGEAAARHLFRVASGLDSVVYGEAQILGQVRDAMMHPANERVAGSLLRRLFQSAVAAGKRVRSETEIGRGAASVAGAALCLLEARAGAFDDHTVLVLGAGETGALVSRLLRKRGVGRLLVANRTAARAEALAREVGAEAYGLDRVPDLVGAADVIVGTVAGREDLVAPALLHAEAEGAPRPRYLLDLAHPRNFSADLAGLPGVQLLDLARVFREVEDAMASRQAQVPRAEAIVDAEVENFLQWLRTRQSAPVLRAVREQILALAQQEAERRAEGRPDEERQALTRFARSLARTLLHAPTVAIREADPETPEGRWLLHAAPSLFGVEAAEPIGASPAGRGSA
ncbi:MAG: glutamyl-tRNA reductase [Longimicrobiales bacterium]|nr:glutamyl-tRNA reductase [Longimicrobiales bacterium]